MKVRFLLDENLSPRLKIAVQRLESDIDIVRIGDSNVLPFGTLDPQVLQYLQLSQRIDIIDNHFSGNYQIFLMIYDREWFETLCDHFPSSTWKAFEFYCADDAELELPIFSERSKGRNEYSETITSGITIMNYELRMKANAPPGGDTLNLTLK